MLKYPDKKTVCELSGKTLFEIERTDAAALKTSAELFTPNGRFVKCGSRVEYFEAVNKPLQLKGFLMTGNVFHNCRIGIWLRSDGRLVVGAN